MIGVLRRVARLGPLRRLLTSRRIEPLVATVLRASPVRGRLRFLSREWRPPAKQRAYRLRESRAIVYVRHGTPDVAALGEVFYERQYEPPERVARALARVDRPLRVLDLGANVGFFALFASLRWPGARVVVFEPDTANLALLRLTRETNRLDWEIVEAAATTSDGEVPFASGGFTLSRIEAGATPVPAVDALPHLARSDLAKIDIEGGEWELLRDERFADSSPAALALEYHTHLAPPQADARALLIRAGYAVERELRFSEGHGLLWAVR